MEEGKKSGISLRKKRTVKPGKEKPTIGAPRQISGPISAPIDPVNSAPARRERPPLNDATSDLVKRRYSTRFTTLPEINGSDVPPVPGLPGLPARYAVQAPDSRPGTGRDGQPGGQQIKVDPKALRDPTLKPEQCEIALI